MEGRRLRLIIVLALLVLTPLGAITWLGLRVGAREQELRREQVQRRLQERLSETADRVARIVSTRQRAVEQALDLPDTATETLRQRVRQSPLVAQIFVRGPRGALQFPPPGAEATEGEREFLMRIQDLWNGAGLTGPAREEAGAGAAPARDGWTSWYWKSGLHLLYWRRLPDGRLIGAEVDRVRLISDLVGELPSTFDGGPQERLGLVDARGEVLYQWGRHEPATDERPRAELALGAPLAAWKLQIHLSPTALSAAVGEGSRLALFVSLGALAVALLGLALWLYHDATRRMRETARRVGFVSQVSHELKTPLTNIRMYAELLERDADDLGPEAQGRLDIIVAESQRLSRLIANVLTFSRQQRRALRVRRRPAELDAVVAGVLEQFAPALADKGIATTHHRGATGTAWLDPDAVGQIVGNLISNVEKYAAAGRSLEVRTAQDAGRARVIVADRGPGVGSRHRKRIFEPFYRADDKVTEGAAGTGIGLSLARDLARLHGGDLRLLPSERGARFELELDVSPTTAPG